MARLTLRPLLVVGVSVILIAFLVACGGGSDDGTSTPGPGGSGATPIPTASPLAVVPAPTILDTSGSTTNPDQPTAPVTYVVVAGDTLSRIAEEFDTTIEDLIEANELTDTNIFIGQELVIPGASAGAAGPATPAPRPNTGVQTYTVQAGDSGFGIALEFGITLEALAAANGLSVDDLTNLQIGQELSIPAP